MDLKDEDPQTWLKLQKYPQFRPLHNTALGLKAADKHIAAGIGFVSGSITGSVEKWLETTVKDMMKRDRFGPYANVLRTETKPLNAKPPSYSNSRFGQHLKVEDARLEKTAAVSAKAMDQAAAAKRTGVVTAVSRTGNVLIELGFGALKVETFSGISYIRGIEIAERLKKSGILDADEAYMLPRMLASHEFDKVIEMIKSGMARAEGSR